MGRSVRTSYHLSLILMEVCCMSFYPIQAGRNEAGWQEDHWNFLNSPGIYFCLHRDIDQRDGGDYHQTRCKVQLSLNIESRNSCSSSRAHSALQDSGRGAWPAPLHSMIFYATKSRTAEEKKLCVLKKQIWGRNACRIRRMEIFSRASKSKQKERE